MFGNWGDLPSAIVLSITSTTPFNGTEDGNLGLAFVSIYILVVYVSSFALQGIRIVQLDYKRQIDAALELRYEDGEFGTARKYLNRLLRGRPMEHELEEERARRDKRDEAGAGTNVKSAKPSITVEEPPHRPRMASIATQTDGGDGEITSVPLAAFPFLEPVPSGLALSHHSSNLSAASPSPSHHPHAGIRIAHGIWVLLRPIFQSPPCLSLLSALIISLVPTLRALFVAPTDGSSFHPTAPDGDPPLAVLYDTASFVGGASIPTGLTVLGASMGKIRLPRRIGRLPLASIASMSVVRLVIQPIIGFFFVRELVRVGMVSAENKVLRFVMVTLSCVPTATLQVTYSILFAPPGQQNNSELVASHLIFQYVVWAFSSVILTAFCLNDLF
ncbi:Protein M3 [Rhodotorula kratochvilovae]